MRSPFPAVLLAFACALLLSACQEQTSQTTTGDGTDTLSASSSASSEDARAGSTQASRGDGSTDASRPSGPTSVPEGEYTTTSSGLKYYDIEEGSGASPSATDRVRVHYTGWLRSDSTNFDSSYDRGQPAAFSLNRVIEGWTEGLQSMQVGGTRQLVVPPELGYGQRGTPGGPIPPGASLIFRVELLGVEGQSGGNAQSGGTP